MAKSSKLTKKLNLEIIVAIVVAIVIAVIIILVAVLGSHGYERPTIKPSEIDSSITAKKLANNPYKFKDKDVKLKAEVAETAHKKDNVYQLQILPISESYSNKFIGVWFNSSSVKKLRINDYVVVTGRVTSPTTQRTFAGTTIVTPRIFASSVQKISHDKALHPARKVLQPKLSQAKADFTISINKIAFAKDETRLYFTVKNTSHHSFIFYDTDVKVVQGGTQIEQKSSFDNDDEMPSEILAGTHESGKIYFKKMNPNQPIKILANVLDDDSYATLNYTFKIN